MSELRRRVPPADTPTLSDGETPTPPPEQRIEHVHVVEHIDKPKSRKRRNTFIFFLGSLFGLIAAGFFAKSNDLIDFPEFGEISVDSLFDALPAGLVADMRDLLVSALMTHEYPQELR